MLAVGLQHKLLMPSVPAFGTLQSFASIDFAGIDGDELEKVDMERLDGKKSSTVVIEKKGDARWIYIDYNSKELLVVAALKLDFR